MRVLLAVETMKDGVRLVEHLAEKAKDNENEYLILSCVEPTDFDDFCMTIYGYDTQSQVLGLRVKAAQRLVSDIKNVLLKKLPNGQVETEVVIGQPRTVILETAKTWKPAEIIVGTHSRVGIEKMWLGSVSEAIATEAPCTVAVIR
jgi:nucleotide-binding universal stress UspA family protein